MPLKLLFVMNDPGYFMLHWQMLVLPAQQAGFEVHVATPPGEAVAEIRALGAIHHEFPLRRSGKNPFVELAAFCALFRIFRRLKPAIVHLLTIKPVIYGGIGARLAGASSVVATIPGLGYAFARQGMLCALVRRLYRHALAHRNIQVIFLNPENREIISRIASLAPERSCLSRAPGLDLTEYAVSPLPEGVPLVVLAARMLKDKGVVEFVEAARLLRKNGCEARFALVGEPDSGNPASLTKTDIEEWRSEGVVECLGYRPDMPEVLKMSSLVVLPSYYHEGMPRVLMEAEACGRAVVTTDWPGCRDAITPNVTGLLVPPRDAVALAEAIRTLLNDRERLQVMGKAGRALAEEAFDVRQVVRQHLEIYRSLMERV
jgi:glycosyltransferase involved in cell wall biosynthesis